MKLSVPRRYTGHESCLDQQQDPSATTSVTDLRNPALSLVCAVTWNTVRPEDRGPSTICPHVAPARPAPVLPDSPPPKEDCPSKKPTQKGKPPIASKS